VSLPGCSELVVSYRVAWDNGASACGVFPYEFDTYEEADAFGKEWADENNLRDFGTTEPDEGYTYEVVELEMPRIVPGV
jgi:hypothetical protein